MSRFSLEDSIQAQWEAKFLESGALSPKLVNQVEWALWYNPIRSSSLRLTHGGYKWVVDKCNFTAYKFKLNDAIDNRCLLLLDRQFTAPYYIKTRKEISVFGEQDALMLQLNAGDLRSYLLNLNG